MYIPSFCLDALSYASLCDFSVSICLVSSCNWLSICCGLVGKLLPLVSSCWLLTSWNIIGDGAIGDGAIGDRAIGDGVIGDGAIGDGAIGDSAIGDGVIGDGAIGDGDITDEGISIGDGDLMGVACCGDTILACVVP